MIDHGFEPRLDHTKIHSVIVHGFEPRLDQVKKQCDRSWVRLEPRLDQTKKQR